MNVASARAPPTTRRAGVEPRQVYRMVLSLYGTQHLSPGVSDLGTAVEPRQLGLEAVPFLSLTFE